jgi:phosphoribosylglycinamide formyltransferase 1
VAASGPVVLLCTDCPASRILFHHLTQELGEVAVVQEEPVSRMQLVRRRIRKLGPVTVFGQLLFLMLVVPLLERRGRARIDDIKRQFAMVDLPMSGVRQVASVNSEEARQVLRELDPVLVIVCGTRIIGAETLRAVAGPIVNYHAGMTPAYRGVHGGYWALVEGRPDLAGSTVHLVDEGIDTGGVLEQRTFEVSHRDSFATYQYLHLAAALPAIVSVARRVLAGGELAATAPRPDLASRLHSHPTLWGYLRAALLRRVR